MSRTVNPLCRRMGLALSAAVLVGAGFLTTAVGSVAIADDWPNKPVHIIVGFAAGGGSDRQARLLAGSLEKALGTPIVVQNMPGAGGQVAAVSLLREAPDGYSILAVNEPDLSMTSALKTSPYKYEDFDILMAEIFDPGVLLVQNDSPIKTFADFVETAKAQPDKLSISVTQGNAQELFAKWLISSLGLKVRVVGFKGGGPATTALLGGHVTATFGYDFSRLNIRERSRALIVCSPQGSPRWPEAELATDALKPYGVTPPTSSFVTRFGVYVVPSKFRQAHPDRYQKLQKAFADAMASKEYKDPIEKQGFSDLILGDPGDKHKEAFAKTLATIKALVN